MPSERERRWLVAHRYPLPFGEVVEVGLPTVSGAIAGQTGTAERDGRLVVERAVVDVDHARLDPLGKRESARERAGVDRPDEAVRTVVGECQRLLVGPERRHRGDRSEDL